MISFATLQCNRLRTVVQCTNAVFAQYLHCNAVQCWIQSGCGELIKFLWDNLSNYTTNNTRNNTTVMEQPEGIKHKTTLIQKVIMHWIPHLSDTKYSCAERIKLNEDEERIKSDEIVLNKLLPQAFWRGEGVASGQLSTFIQLAQIF